MAVGIYGGHCPIKDLPPFADCCALRLINFTLQASPSSGTNPVYSYTDRGGHAQLVYTMVPSPPIGFSVKSVQIDISKNTDPQNILTLCEFYVFGELACPASKFGCQCERDCNCADATEACFVSTGGCPSGCAAGYTGEDCFTRAVIATVAVVIAAVVLGIFLWRQRRTATNHCQSPSSDKEVKGDAQHPPPPTLPGPPVRSINDKTHENRDHLSTQGNQNQRPYHTLQHPENDGDGDHVYETTDDPYERPLSLVGDCEAYENPLPIGVTSGSDDLGDEASPYIMLNGDHNDCLMYL
ncbi:receptor-type tyrosine-protein phosphatase kappa-like [Plakobranchus ocellatus]|uniref:Receptor-type tyrosine-protein phosphatase kappa-like n=1 Tax=Plakobranchus ocellatus TaxID=259542 RepID=A0AAV4CXE5_9GAST|nr:receptor-type tyrosine-protein phosphatase kappa-like [Plakobranchus ocellatus]